MRQLAAGSCPAPSEPEQQVTAGPRSLSSLKKVSMWMTCRGVRTKGKSVYQSSFFLCSSLPKFHSDSSTRSFITAHKFSLDYNSFTLSCLSVVTFFLYPLSLIFCLLFCLFFLLFWEILPSLVCFPCSLQKKLLSHLCLGKLVFADICDSLPKSSLVWARALAVGCLYCAWGLIAAFYFISCIFNKKER